MESVLPDNFDEVAGRIGSQSFVSSLYRLENQHLSKSQVLEMAYQESLRNADSIVKEEDSRRLRLRIVMLESENDELHEQMALGDDRYDALEQEHADMRDQLEQAQMDALRHENDLRIQTREVNKLKVCEITTAGQHILIAHRLNWCQ